MNSSRYFACLVLGFFGATVPIVEGSPDLNVSFVERLVGVGNSSWSVLRTEDSNMCSYYASSKKTFLEERSRDGGKTLKVTLLLETKRSVDPDHTDGPAYFEVISKDSDTKLSDVIERCPVASPVNWDEKKLHLFDVSQNAGISLRGHRLLGSEQVAGYFNKEHPELAWRLAGVAEDDAGIYLTITKEEVDSYKETRVICLSSSSTANVKAQVQLPETCLQAGSFASKEEALAKAKELAKSTFYAWQVWLRTDSNVQSWVVICKDSDQAILDDSVQRLEKKADIHLLAVSNRSLHEWIADIQP